MPQSKELGGEMEGPEGSGALVCLGGERFAAIVHVAAEELRTSLRRASASAELAGLD
jgi:hypothetical protein